MVVEEEIMVRQGYYTVEGIRGIQRIPEVPKESSSKDGMAPNARGYLRILKRLFTASKPTLAAQRSMIRLEVSIQSGLIREH